MSVVTWRETNTDKIIAQWGNVLRKSVPLFSWSKPSTKDIEAMQPDIKRIRQIALDTFRLEAIERRYTEQEFTEPVSVIFPGNIIRECSLEDVRNFKDYVIPTPDCKKMVLIGRSFFNCLAPKSIMGFKGNYSSSWQCVMDPRQLSLYHNLGWAIRGIDYGKLGFKVSTTKGFLGTYRTWEAPHHFEFQTTTMSEISYYGYKLDQYRSWNDVP